MPFLRLISIVIGSVLTVSAAKWLFSGHALVWRRTFARNRTAAVTGAILLVGIGRLALLPLRGIPRPAVVDEFSYLFMADTFAAGRLAYPPHPLWQELESPFILSQPTHASVYPVAQGLILAAGKIATGIPWIGIVVCSALMCGAICWMLQGWFPAHWAVLGTLLAIFQFGVNSYWINSYWGGAHAALGGRSGSGRDAAIGATRENTKFRVAWDRLGHSGGEPAF